jgi:branched-chain amino acid transport system substrate-binding protein
MTTKGKLGVVIVIIIIVLGGWYMISQRTFENNSVIKIGVPTPLTGEAASFGDGFVAGGNLAMKEIKDSGGINGKMIELIYEDDSATAKGGLAAINKLVNIDKVTVLVGPLSSAASGAGLPIAQESKTPTIIMGSAPHLTKIGDYIFRNYPSDALQGKYAAEFMINNLKKKTAAVLYVKNDWGQGLQDVFSKRFTELGGTVVYNDGVAQDTTDLKSFVSKIKASNAEILYLPLYPKLAIIGLKQLKDAGVNTPIMSGDAFEAEEILKSGFADGAMYTVATFQTPEEFKTRIKSMTDKNMNIFTPLIYDAVNIFADIMKKVGTDQKAIQRELVKTSYTKGVSLPLIEFDENGDLKTAQFEVRVVSGTESVPYNK